ncbi:MAG: DUF4190 domain-containing protein [Phycisphaeraceae bacterium]|nr:DUF4190 domain-containing protein [Phycisphaerae bacterium]MBX3393410.1 DUF4190 domain-containing protein [Phycisphaeraceae bacterium]
MTSATFDTRNFEPEPDVLEPERMSILAILALVFGLICFIPLLPLLGIVCGISGLISINRSRGRLAGTGMAIAGLILGLLFTALQGAIGLGMVKALQMVSKEMVAPASALASSLDNQDFEAVRQSLVVAARPLATDEAGRAFRDGYRDELGAFKSIPEGWDLVMAYASLGSQFQSMQNLQGVQGRNDLLPFPATFEKGTGLLLLTFEQPSNNAVPGKDRIFYFKNVALIMPSGKVINLIDPDSAAMIAPAIKVKEPPQPPDSPDSPELPDSTAQDDSTDAGQGGR